MGNLVYGPFTLPPARKTSELENNSRFSSIREYAVNSSTLSGSIILEVDDLPANAIIYQIDVMIRSPFTVEGSQANLEIQTKKNDVLMNRSWNDPTVVGTYSSECYYITDGSSGEVRVVHNLGSNTTGLFILRLYLYENVGQYESFQTSQNQQYRTKDKIAVDVRF